MRSTPRLSLGVVVILFMLTRLKSYSDPGTPVTTFSNVDPSYSATSALSTGKASNDRISAASQIPNQEALVELVQSGESSNNVQAETLALAAVQKVTNQSLLKRWAKMGPECIREGAMAVLNDRLFLKTYTRFDYVDLALYDNGDQLAGMADLRYVLTDPRVVKYLGDIKISVSRETIDGGENVTYTVPGERQVVTLSGGKLTRDLIEITTTNFPDTVSAGVPSVLPAPSAAANLIRRILKQCPRNIASEALKSIDYTDTLDVTEIPDTVQVVGVESGTGDSNPPPRDQKTLTDIAVNGKNESARVDAVLSLSDQRLLTQLALHDKSTKVRVAAVNQLISDPASIRMVLSEAQNEDVRLAVVSRLTAVLSEKREDEDNPQADDTYIKDERDLLLAVHDPDKLVRLAVVNALDDQAELVRISRRDKDHDVRHAAKIRWKFLQDQGERQLRGEGEIMYPPQSLHP